MNLHLIFNRPANELKVFRDNGDLVLRCEARNETIGPEGTDDPFGHFGPCPPGEGYRLRPPASTNEPSTGRFFIELLDDPAGDFSKHERAAIGIHGGGSGLSDPFASHQGWVPTEGCIRLQNEDLERLVQLVDQAQATNGGATIDVVDPKSE